MKTLLINPPYTKDRIFRKSLKNVGAILPPLGLASIAAILEKAGQKVKIIDGPALSTVYGYSFDDLKKDIRKYSPDIEDVQAIAVPILSHRVVKNYKAEAEGITIKEIITSLF